MRPITALCTFSVIALPWFIAVGIATNGVWPREFFLVHNVARFTQAFEGHHGGWFYYILVICIGTYPWSIFMYHGLRLMGVRLHRDNPFQSACLLLCSWIVVWIGFFTFAGTKLPHYIMPAYPAMAIIFGCFIEASLSGSFQVSRGWMWASWTNLVVVGIVTLIALPMATLYYLPGEEILGIVGFVPITGGIVCLWAEYRHRRGLAYFTVAAVAVFLSLSVLAWGGTRVDRYQQSRLVASWIHELSSKTSSKLSTYGFFDYSLVYYTDKKIYHLLDATSVTRFLESDPGNTFVLTTDKKLVEIKSDLPSNVTVLRQTPRFLRNEELILLGQIKTSHQADRSNSLATEQPKSR